MRLRGWDALATWRDSRMGERGDLWHRAIIDPALLRIVGPVRGLDILDLACGNGYLTRRWARAGARQSLGIEKSARAIALARSREAQNPSGAKFLRSDSARLTGVGTGGFDLVVANMAIADIPDAAGTFREVSRLLRPEGRFVFSLPHPCFDLDERSMWTTELARGPDGRSHAVTWRKVRAYRDEGSLLTPWWISEKVSGFTESYPRMLSTYSRLLRECGFAITRLEEPMPLPEALRSSPQAPGMLEVPLHLVVEARLLLPPWKLRARARRTEPDGRVRATRTRRNRRLHSI